MTCTIVVFNNGKPKRTFAKILPAWNYMREEHTRRGRGDHKVTVRVEGSTTFFEYFRGGYDNFHNFIIQERRRVAK